MVKYPLREKIRQNLDITIHGLCSHISKDLHVFIKKQILASMPEFEGLSLREVDVLMCVAYFKDTVTSSDVATTIRYDPATVTRATRKLLDNELLSKDDNDYDARSMVLMLTERGRELAEKFSNRCADALAEAERELTMRLSEEEQAQLLKLLLKMRERSMQYAKIKRLSAA